jgi:YrbI family 3-deoxy-D-manno-octulosonate 8-phosphate phosphatase
MAQPLNLPNAAAAGVALVVLDFDGVITDNTVWINQQGEEMVRCWRSDGLGLSQLRALGVAVLVLSTEANPVVAQRCKKLQLPCQTGLADKATALRAVLQTQQLSPATVVYVGNDINDRDCLQIVGVSIVVADAHPAVVELAQYQTQRAGGFGAVREVCDWIVAAKSGN